MAFKAGNYDIVVVGAGHAGCEAALAAARLGKKVLILTVNLDSVALMPCNPAIGGPAKGHIVREIDALGGEMGRAIDDTLIQLRMLNTSKGPAVRTLRAQADKITYQLRMRKALEAQPRVSLKQGLVEDIVVVNGAVQGVITQTGAMYESPVVILTTGTYLSSKVVIGDIMYASGPNGLQPANNLTASLQRLGVDIARFKTGTPPRVSRRTIDTDKMDEQPGDLGLPGFSRQRLTMAPDKQLACWLTYTNERTHAIIKENFHRAPLFSGGIEGTGPRYCPSIEDKINRFSDRPRHQIFVEPEGWDTDEMYVQGFSTSLPEDVQIAALRTIQGLEKAEIVRPGYAIEYDMINPTQLKLSLEMKNIKGLFSAGQINGSSGYEEAAAQGLISGINAVRFLQGVEPVVLKRSEAYIGVLIDDLVTKGTSEPYRMMTSRAEYRLLLRHDNAETRLLPLGYEIGLVTEEVFAEYVTQQSSQSSLKERLASLLVVAGDDSNRVLESVGTTPLTQSSSALNLLKRPEVTIDDLAVIFPELLKWDSYVREQVEIEIKYAGYISKQREQAERALRLEEKRLSRDVDYTSISGMSSEAREKLQKLKPESVGQASRISGVSPADINVLLVWLEAIKRRGGEK